MDEIVFCEDINCVSDLSKDNHIQLYGLLEKATTTGLTISSFSIPYAANKGVKISGDFYEKHLTGFNGELTREEFLTRLDELKNLADIFPTDYIDRILTNHTNIYLKFILEQHTHIDSCFLDLRDLLDMEKIKNHPGTDLLIRYLSMLLTLNNQNSDVLKDYLESSIRVINSSDRDVYLIPFVLPYPTVSLWVPHTSVILGQDNKLINRRITPEDERPYQLLQNIANKNRYISKIRYMYCYLGDTNTFKSSQNSFVVFYCYDNTFILNPELH